ncbi:MULTISPECIES: GntR family transcriptional regulator [unclassified Rhizobium]|uniref:GntR family transcriptional regulator n=1 Tax=Rhizobium TaxID=379 RepID=UPI00084C97D2|nr:MULTISPECIES: GntR family transcriptional regulator [unclassified Rhizobium]OEC98997.1 GntR family transcriptional regulator [Rhizobium sp. YK2]QYA11798.1 GntR family transcriptional regulator [Rhizobium sp. AB2/73]UEQ82272.1 GntR family transcriptional regulator [Rhizobium sp. AB2/73]
MQNSLSHLAYLALEYAIVTLELKPGALVTEKQLIERARHGRTPVREAIQKLAWQGLIHVRPRVGLQIAEIRPEDHQYVMQVRRELEPLAAALAATHADPQQREQLRECARRMEECSVTGNLPGFFAADKAFDEILEAACPNNFITAALASVQTHARRLWYSTGTHDRMGGAIAMHIQAIEAIQAGNADAAEAAMASLIDYLSST